MTSRIHVTVVLLKQFWKAARESLLILFHPTRDSLSALSIYMLLFIGLRGSTLVCPISEMSVSVLFLSLAFCALARLVILGDVTLISRIRIFLFIFLEVKPTNMVHGQPRLACVAAVSFPFPNAREREENCERVAK